MPITDFSSVVEDLKNRFPTEWAAAHRGGPGTEDFVRIVAYVLYTDHDKRFGLNGKRGNPNDISDDALNVYGFDDDNRLVGRDPENGNRRCTTIDFIVGAGGSNPSVGWGVDTSYTGPSAFVIPPKPPQLGGSTGGGGGTTPPPPPPVKCGYDPAVMARLNVIDGALGAIQQQLADIAADAKAAREWAETSAARSSDAIDAGKKAEVAAARKRAFSGRLGYNLRLTEE